MATVQVTDAEFKEKVLEEELPVLVDFWAPWCGPCKLAGPVLEELSKKYEGKVAIVKVNVDENFEAAGKYGVMSIPTVILFKDGKEVDRQIGYGGEAGYVALIGKAVGR